MIIICDFVDHLYNNNGNDTLEILSTSQYTEVVASFNGHGLYAIYDGSTASEPIPEPATMLLVGAGIFGLAVLRKKTKK